MWEQQRCGRKKRREREAISGTGRDPTRDPILLDFPFSPVAFPRDPTPEIRLQRLLIEDSPRLASSVGKEARLAPEPCGPAATRPLPPEHRAQESLSPSSLEARGPELSSVPSESQSARGAGTALRANCAQSPPSARPLRVPALSPSPRPLPESTPLRAASWSSCPSVIPLRVPLPVPAPPCPIPMSPSPSPFQASIVANRVETGQVRL